MSANIKREIKDAIKKAGCKNGKVYDFIDIKVAEDTVLQPDAVVVCKNIVKPFLDFPASLVVEILSPFTAMKDRNNKFYIYQSQQIPYYIIIDTAKNEIEIYRLAENGKYELAKTDSAVPYSFHLDSDCNVEVLLNNIWE